MLRENGNCPNVSRKYLENEDWPRDLSSESILWGMKVAIDMIVTLSYLWPPLLSAELCSTSKKKKKTEINRAMLEGKDQKCTTFMN